MRKAGLGNLGMLFHSPCAGRVSILRRSFWLCRHCEVVLVFSIEEKCGVLLATPRVKPDAIQRQRQVRVTRSSSSNGHQRHVVGSVWHEVRVTTVLPPAISGRESVLRPVTTTTVVLPTVGRMTAPTGHLHNEKYHIQDELDISRRMATQPCSSSRCDKLETIKVTIRDHDPAEPQREGSKSWLSTLIILVSISLSFISVFQVHRALPSRFRGFLIPSFRTLRLKSVRIRLLLLSLRMTALTKYNGTTTHSSCVDSASSYSKFSNLNHHSA